MYSSTTLEGPSKSGCWKMLDFAESNTPSLFPLEYRSYLGQAAHAVCQYCAERRADTEEKIRAVAEEVGNSLIRDGREFRGRTEPPLPPDDVWAGVDVAVQYLLARGLPLEADALYPERDWVHPRLPYRALIDLVAIYDEGDEEYEKRVCEVTDYKSSWQAGEGELDTLQRWGQAICMWRQVRTMLPPEDLEEEDYTIIRQRVVNLRSWGEWTRDIRLDDPDDVAELEKWEKRIAALCATAAETWDADAQGIYERPANLGVGCLSCAWRHVCEDAWTVGDIPIMDGEALAVEYAAAKGRVKMLEIAIKEMDKDEPIAIPGGFVGFQEKVKRVPLQGSERHLLSDWFAAMAADIPEDLAPVLTSLLSALDLGKGNLDAFAKALHPERQKGIVQVREDYVEGYTSEKRYSQFGVWKDE